MSTPRKTKRPALGSKPIAYGWVFTDGHGKVVKALRGAPLLFKTKNKLRDYSYYPLTGQVRVAIVPVTRGKKKARAK